MATANTSVKDLMQVLTSQHAALCAKLDTVTDPGLGDAINAQALEILHRINVTQNLLLVAATDEVTDAVVAVKAAGDKLTQDLQDIADTARFIDSVSVFLGRVDSAIAMAKKVAVL
jgi:hypothetical protein